MTLEGTVVFLVFLALVFTLVQAATVYYAKHVALAAAQEGVNAARAQGGTVADGKRTAADFISRAGGDWLTEPQVADAGSGPGQVRLKVTGTAISLIPGKTWRVTQEAAGPRERPAR